jgi:hypothetical protein
MVKRDATKMIMVTVGFWTDSLPPGADALPFGTVAVRANSTHSIKAGRSVPFNSKEELADKVFAALARAGVKLAPPAPRRGVRTRRTSSP